MRRRIVPQSTQANLQERPVSDSQYRGHEGTAQGELGYKQHLRCTHNCAASAAAVRNLTCSKQSAPPPTGTEKQPPTYCIQYALPCPSPVLQTSKRAGIQFPMRPSVTSSTRASHAPGSQPVPPPPSAALLARLADKKKEFEAVDALQRASALFLRRLEGLADDCEEMAEAGIGAFCIFLFIQFTCACVRA